MGGKGHTSDLSESVLPSFHLSGDRGCHSATTVHGVWVLLLLLRPVKAPGEGVGGHRSSLVNSVRCEGVGERSRFQGKLYIFAYRSLGASDIAMTNHSERRMSSSHPPLGLAPTSRGVTTTSRTNGASLALSGELHGFRALRTSPTGIVWNPSIRTLTFA